MPYHLAFLPPHSTSGYSGRAKIESKEEFPNRDGRDGREEDYLIYLIDVFLPVGRKLKRAATDIGNRGIFFDSRLSTPRLLDSQTFSTSSSSYA